ncbi:MAG: glycerate kinase [Bacteroidaceae bacterium]|nr:glycerate kinase [Bacteroidaceae bacterium]
MKKIIIAIDSFKGSLTSIEAGKAVEKGILQTYPEAQTTVIPIADGGEGMLNVMLNATKGTIHTLRAHNPCMELIESTYGISADGTTAFIEMAAISGLPLIQDSQKNPMETSSFGTGELIKNALEKGCTRFIIGIGGSATNDAGTGMLQALGFRFLDKDGKVLRQGGKILDKIVHVCTQNVHKKLKNAHFIVACDVQNPFYGPNGSAQIYARQKGADDTMIAALDHGMRHFSEVIFRETGKDIAHVPGSGAAGGMGGGMMAYLNAELKSGADLLLDICQLEKKISDVDFIITGEGRIDKQSLMGKIPGKILKIGIQHNVPVIAITGCVEDKELLNEAGFYNIYTCKPKEMSLKEAMIREVALQNIQNTAASITI